MTQTLRKQNVTVVASVWPMSANTSTHYAQLVQGGMLSLYEDGQPRAMDTWCDGHVYVSVDI